MYSTYCPEVIHFPTSTVLLPYAGHCLYGCPEPQYLQFFTNLFSFILSLCSLFLTWFCLSLLNESNSYASLILPSALFALLLSGPILRLAHCLPPWHLTRAVKLFCNLGHDGFIIQAIYELFL